VATKLFQDQSQKTESRIKTWQIVFKLCIQNFVNKCFQAWIAISKVPVLYAWATYLQSHKVVVPTTSLSCSWGGSFWRFGIKKPTFPSKASSIPFEKYCSVITAPWKGSRNGSPVTCLVALVVGDLKPFLIPMNVIWDSFETHVTPLYSKII
jgi:hypothetical protein